jgi:hypothetical protein
MVESARVIHCVAPATGGTWISTGLVISSASWPRVPASPGHCRNADSDLAKLVASVPFSYESVEPGITLGTLADKDFMALDLTHASTEVPGVSQS